MSPEELSGIGIAKLSLFASYALKAVDFSFE
jgi:hypothetical protein